MSRLLNLPSELLVRSFSHVDRASLKSLRQSCRLTSQLATDQLYRTVHLKPSETSQKALQEILNNPTICQIPRKIYIDTVDESIVRFQVVTSVHLQAIANVTQDYKEEIEQDLPEGWKDLLPQVKKLPRLNAVVLSFDKGFTSDGDDRYHYWDFPQTRKFRSQTMYKVFALLDSLQHPIQDLGIRHLQTDNPKNEKTLARMSKVLSGLRSLRLSITNETNDAAPENDLQV